MENQAKEEAAAEKAKSEHESAAPLRQGTSDQYTSRIEYEKSLSALTV